MDTANLVAKEVVEYYQPYRHKSNFTATQVHGSVFNIDERYRILEKIGQGAYGVVSAAIDQVKRKSVAIKKIEKAFDQRIYTKRTLRELKLLRLLTHENKPRNLLVNSNCDLKICDFGLARSVANTKNDLTDYVTTRWYRPPELLLSWTDYTCAMDVWSVGIIFAELIKRKPLLPGSSSSDQLLRIFDLIGTPSDNEIAMIPYDEYRKFIRELPKREPKQFEKIFSKAPKEALDLLKKMLTFDFNKRITVEEALKHPYLSDLHLPEDEPSRSEVPFYEFEFEIHSNLTRQQYKDLVYEEILLYHFPEFKKKYLEKISNNQSVMQHIFDNANKNIVDEEFSSDTDY